MFCPNCGTRSTDDARFCTTCGRKMPPMEPVGAALPVVVAPAPATPVAVVATQPMAAPATPVVTPVPAITAQATGAAAAPALAPIEPPAEATITSANTAVPAAPSMPAEANSHPAAEAP